MGVIKIVNKYNLTTKQIKGKSVEYRLDNHKPVPLGVFMHADEDYLYVDYNGDKDIIIEFSESVSIEMGGEDSV